MNATPLRIAAPPEPAVPIEEARIELMCRAEKLCLTLGEAMERLTEILANDRSAERGYDQISRRLDDATGMARRGGNDGLAVHLEGTRDMLEAFLERDRRDDEWTRALYAALAEELKKTRQCIEQLREMNLKGEGA